MNNTFLNARDFGARGSEFKTIAYSRLGSKELRVDNIGDFEVGDEVIVIGAAPHFVAETLFERKDMKVKDRRPWKHNQPLDGRVELAGYDGTQGDFITYFIDMCPEEPDTFRWSNDFGVNWHENVKITKDWIPLEGKIRVKINDFKEREWGCTASFACSSRMIAKIESINGDKLTLSSAATLDAKCEIMHSDSGALQAAIDTAIAEKKNLFLPSGKYRLTKTLNIINPDGFTLLGESETATILDNSLGDVGIERLAGSCFYAEGGNAITLKNLFMIGCYGFDERAKGANLFCKGGTAVYGFYFRKSNATCFKNTKNILVENCHARKMSAECFYSMGTARETAEPADSYTRSITYLRCSVEDCARNAFNNNDKAEGTSLLFCRIKDVGNAAWEGASRFVKIHGCYISNAGCIAIGNVRRRADNLTRLGTAQHIITDNYFEAKTSSPTFPMIKIGSFATQVTVKGNTFVNFNSKAIDVTGENQSVDTPPENIIISGNSIDLTAIGEESRERYGIRITSNFVTVSDNHIYVRGECDSMVKGIIISDDVTRLNIHDNTICGCEVGIISEEVRGSVGDVVSDTVFYRREGRSSTSSKPMLLRTDSHRYRGWKLKWQLDGTESEISDFDPVALTFTLKEARKMHDGDEFQVYSPVALPWSIHHNIIDNCEKVFSLDTYGGKKAVLDANIYSERKY